MGSRRAWHNCLNASVSTSNPVTPPSNPGPSNLVFHHSCQSDLDSRVIPGSDVLTFDSVRLQVPLCSIPPDAKGAEYASGNLFPPRTEVSVKSKYNSTTNSSTHSVVWGRELSPPTMMLSEKEAPRVRDVSLPLISIPSQETGSGEFAASSREET